MWISLRIRLTLIFIGLAVGPLLFVGIVLADRSFRAEQEQAIDLQRQVVQRVSTEIEAFLQERESELRLLGGELRRSEEFDRAQQISLLLSTFNSGVYPDIYEEFALLDVQGQEQFRIARLEIILADQLKSRSGTAEFEQPKASGETYFSPVWFDETTGESFLTIAIPLFNLRSVKLNSVLIADLRFERIGKLIADLEVSAGQTIYVVDAGGRVVAHQDRSVELQNKRFEAAEQRDIQTGLAGSQVVLAVNKVQFGDQTFTIVAEKLASEALAPANNTVMTIAVTIVIALVVAIILGLLIVRQVVKPVETLAVMARAISAGDLSQRAKVTSRDELGELANVFNSMAAQLQEIIGRLEQHVADRTRRLEIVATLGEYLNAILDTNELLSEVVEQVKDNFGYYHAHIYLLDDEQEKLIVVAGTGPAGAEMKTKGHSIALDAASLVTRAFHSADVVTVDNVYEVEDWLPNPLLPNTHSEMAVPIILDGAVVGVLDVQEDKIAGLNEGDAGLLRSLANQVAIAIRNARLFEEVQTALTEARELQRRYIEEVWDKDRLSRQAGNRVQFSLGESSTLDEATIIEARRLALNQTEPELVTLANQTQISVAESAEDEQQAEDTSQSFEPSAHNRLVTSDSKQVLVAPVRLHGVPIGNLQLHQGNSKRMWTKHELALINAVIDQVAQTAENIRLLDSIQERASREQLIGQISAKLRRAPDMETLLEIGVTELMRVLNPAHTFIRLGSKTELTAEPSPDSQNNHSSKSEDTAGGETIVESDRSNRPENLS